MIGDRLARIRQDVQRAAQACGRNPSDIRLLAVSKGHPASAVREAWEAGLRDFGENYVQEWSQKAEAPELLGLQGIRWHFIGSLQRNKIKFLLGRVASIETIDRFRLAAELARRASEANRTQEVLLQVNLEEELSKSGFTRDELQAGLGDLLSLEGLAIRGLMAIPTRRDQPQDSRPDHRQLALFRDELQERWGHPLPELSMGMSSDFTIAIEEGSTEIRLGTALFGPRPPRA